MQEAAGVLWRPAGGALVQRLCGAAFRSVATAGLSGCRNSQDLRQILPFVADGASAGAGWSALAVAKWRTAAMGAELGAAIGVRRGYSCGRVLGQEMQRQPAVCKVRVVPYSTESVQQSWVNKWKAFRAGLKEGTSSKGAAAASTSLVRANVATQKVLDGPLESLKRLLLRYRDAAQLQVEGFWKRNYLIVVGAGAVATCLLLWRIMFGIASTFVGLSETMAKFGFLALAAALVVLGGLILRARFTINPDAVYRTAIRKLNTSAALLEVLGAPLTGTEVRAYVMSGGGLKLKKFKPRLSGKRCFLIFPVRGSERKGLVSVEAKKKNGQYHFKLLAVDVPTAGGDQRIFVIGDEAEYKVGGGLISELREPILKAMEAQKEFDDEDEREAEEEERLQAEQEFKDQQKKEVTA